MAPLVGGQVLGMKAIPKPPLGSRVRIGSCAGLLSNLTGTVVPPVPWRTIPGMYEPPCRNEVCIQLDPGQRHPSALQHVFMPAGRVYGAAHA